MKELPSVFKTVEERNCLSAMLKELGVETVMVSFSGSGDSGAIDAVNFFSAQKRTDYPGLNVELNVGDVMVPEAPYTSQAWNDMTKTWETTSGVKPMRLSDYMEYLCYEALEHCGLDWYNNDGGQGDFNMTFDEDGTPIITLNVSVNYTETDDFSFEVEA